MGIIKKKSGDWKNITVYRDARGVESYRVRVCGKDGKLYYAETVYDAEEARRKRDKAKLEVKGATDKELKVRKMTMSDLFDWYSESVLPSKASHEEEASIINGILRKSRLVDLKVMDIRVDDIEQFISDRRDGSLFPRGPVSGATICRNLNVLSDMFTEADKRLDAHFPKGHPVRRTPKPDKDWIKKERKRRAHNADEIAAIIKYIEDNPYYEQSGEFIDAIALFQLGYLTGIRIGVLCELRREQFDEENECIKVDEGQQKNEDDSNIPLTEYAMPIFKRLYDANEDKTTRFFPVRSSKAASQYFVRVKKKLKLPKDVVFHSTRHKFSTELYSALPDASFVMQFTKHSTLVAFKTYNRPESKKMASIANKALREAREAEEAGAGRQ